MKTLCIDIETTPNLAHVWGLWDQNVGLNQLLEATEMMCFAAKWLGEPKMYFGRNWAYGEHDPIAPKEQMIGLAHSLLDEADVVMHFNGRRFDVPHLNREFVQAGWLPPSPYQQIDLLSAVKAKFKFPSNKLDYVLKALGLEGKVKHAGHELWIQCMAGNEKAWRQMATYNKRDVRALEDLYYRIQPWVPGHPNVGLFVEEPGLVDMCPACGSTNLKLQGNRYTAMGKYQRYQCSDCGKWSSDGKRVGATNIREVRG